MKQPADRKVSLRDVSQALSMQAANVTQKAFLDTLTTKVVRVKQVLESADATKPTSLRSTRDEALRVLGLDRHAIQELRPVVELDDPAIQEILDRAVNEMVAVLLKTDRAI